MNLNNIEDCAAVGVSVSYLCMNSDHRG